MKENYLKLVMRSALLVVQILVASFYAISVVLMWGPFVSGPVVNKLGVAAIIFWPMIGLIVASRGVPGNRLGVTPVLGLLTVLHLVIVFAGAALL